MHSLVRDWPGDLTIVNGRPRDPKCQGLVEQGNSVVEKLIGARLRVMTILLGQSGSFIQCKLTLIGNM